MLSQRTPNELRLMIRNGHFDGMTSGYCQGFIQCNLVILPADWAEDFLGFCKANPKPCPLISKSVIGDPILADLGKDIDIRSDISRYRIFKHGELCREVRDITDVWQDNLVAFLLGCSFSFEEALISSGLEVRNISQGVNVPMYRSNIDCQPFGAFYGKMVVSMRPFNSSDSELAKQISSRFPKVHGAPIHHGNPSEIGIFDLNKPDYGDAVNLKEGEEPLFWACGVTPQVALEQAKPPLCITHSPGCMLVTDLLNSTLEQA